MEVQNYRRSGVMKGALKVYNEANHFEKKPIVRDGRLRGSKRLDNW